MAFWFVCDGRVEVMFAGGYWTLQSAAVANFPGNRVRRGLHHPKRCLMLLGRRPIAMGLRCPTVC